MAGDDDMDACNSGHENQESSKSLPGLHCQEQHQRLQGTSGRRVGYPKQAIPSPEGCLQDSALGSQSVGNLIFHSWRGFIFPTPLADASPETPQTWLRLALNQILGCLHERSYIHHGRLKCILCFFQRKFLFTDIIYILEKRR